MVSSVHLLPHPQEGYNQQADGYFQYVNVPAHKEYEFGWNRGNPQHYVSRYEQSKDHRFRTRVRIYLLQLLQKAHIVSQSIRFSCILKHNVQVKWGDHYGGYGEQYYEFKHGPTYEDSQYKVPDKPEYIQPSNYIQLWALISKRGNKFTTNRHYLDECFIFT